MKVDVGFGTSVGRVRTANEDNLLVLPQEGVFVVADGMGGHDDGEVAAQVVIDAFVHSAKLFKDPETTAPWQIFPELTDEANFICGTILWANETICHMNLQKAVNEFASRMSGTNHMGTTVVAALLRDGVLTYGHLGDSRLYANRNGKLTQLTKDHTLAQKYADAGVPLPAYLVNNAGILMQACGLEKSPQVAIGQVPVKSGDIFLLCSDGLTNEVPDMWIHTFLMSGIDAQQMANDLILMANENGGRDNTTVIVIKVL